MYFRANVTIYNINVIYIGLVSSYCVVCRANTYLHGNRYHIVFIAQALLTLEECSANNCSNKFLCFFTFKFPPHHLKAENLKTPKLSFDDK